MPIHIDVGLIWYFYAYFLGIWCQESASWSKKWSIGKICHFGWQFLPFFGFWGSKYSIFRVNQ